MFGFVMADPRELTPDQKTRYGSIYCGICRQIRLRSGKLARMSLSYDTAFLALLLMSLYEPEETQGKRACGFHPIKPHPWVDNEYIAYAADMNVALAYYKCLDDTLDDGKFSALLGMKLLKKKVPAIAKAYPRQCQAIADCIQTLSQLEQEGCADPDRTAGCFGALMAELFVYREDLWADTLRQMGMALGRYIYLADAAVDLEKDRRKNRYNPMLAMENIPDPAQWEQYLIMAMGRCTQYYEQLPLVQDKAIMDNILYGGVWLQYKRKEVKDTDDR